MAKHKRYTPEQITRVLKQQEAGMKVAEICRQAGICEQTFYRWKSKYGGMKQSELARLRELEDENRKLKKMFADVSLQNMALKDVIEKKL